MSETWPETAVEGQVLTLAFVKLDLAGSSRAVRQLPKDVMESAMARYHDVVATTMEAIGALPSPPHWQGDGATFFVGGEGAAALAAEVALRLVEEARLIRDAELRLRAAVGLDDVRYLPELGAIVSAEFNAAGHLEEICPAGAVLLSEEAFRALASEPELQRRFSFFATITETGRPAFVAPHGHGRSEASDPAALAPADSDPYPMRQAVLRLYQDPAFRLVRFVGAPHFQHVQGVELESVFQAPRLRPSYRPQAWNPAEQDDGSFAAGSVLPSSPVAVAKGKQALPSTPGPSGPKDDGAAATSEGLAEDFAPVFARYRRLVVLGDPGAGKSALLRELALVTGAATRARRLRLGVPEPVWPLHFSVGRLFDVWSEHRSSAPHEVFARYFAGLGAGSTEDTARLAEAIYRSLDVGAALLLFDGLDEAGSGDRRRAMADLIERVGTMHPECRMIVTSRLVGFVPLSIHGVRNFVLEPLDERAARALARSFFSALHEAENPGDPSRSEAAAELRAGSLVDALAARPALRPFMENPLLLALAGLVHSQLGRLPNHRAKLYDVAAQTLIEAWATARLAVPPIRPPRPVDYEAEGRQIFPPLALWMHRYRPGGLIAQAELVRFIERRLRIPAADLLSRISSGGSILVERGSGLWGFLHLSMQEYLAAKALAGDDSVRPRLLARHRYDSRFEEVWRLVSGELGSVQQRPMAAEAFIRSLLADKHPIHAKVLGRNTLLALKCLADTTVSSRKFAERLLLHLCGMLLGKEPRPPEEPLLHAVEELANKERDWLRERFEPLLDGSGPEGRVAIEVLSRIGAKDLVPRWLAMVLGDRDPFFGRAVKAVFALERLADDAVVSRLADVARSDPSPQKRHMAVFALGRFEARSTWEVVASVLRSDSDPGVRESAAAALGRMGVPAAAESLIERLRNDPEQAVRGRAAYALAELPAPGAVNELLRALREDPEGYVRRNAARGLGALRDPAGVQALIEIAQDTLSPGREYAIEAWGEFRIQEASALLPMLKTDSTWVIRAALLLALGRLGAREVAPAAMELLRGDPGESDQRAAAIYVLGEIREKRAAASIRGIAERTHQDFERHRAFRALGKMRDRSSLPLLHRAAAHDPDLDCRLAAVWALEDIRASESIPVLARIADQSDSGATSSAVASFARAALWNVSVEPSRPRRSKSRMARRSSAREAPPWSDRGIRAAPGGQSATKAGPRRGAAGMSR